MTAPITVDSLRDLIINKLKRPEAACTFQLTLSRTAVQKLNDILMTLQDQDGEDVLANCDPNNIFADSYDLNPRAMLDGRFFTALNTIGKRVNGSHILTVIFPSATSAGLFYSHSYSQFLF